MRVAMRQIVGVFSQLEKTRLVKKLRVALRMLLSVRFAARPSGSPDCRLRSRGERACC